MALARRKKTALKILPALIIVVALAFFPRTEGILRLNGAVIGVLAPILGGARRVASALYGSSSQEEPSSTAAREGEANRFARETLTHENETLRRALGLQEETRGNVRAASVLYAGQEFGKSFLILDKGVDEGVGEGDIVVTPERMLIGMIQEAGRGFAKVALAANPGQLYDGEVVPLGARTLLRGLGAGAFSLDLVPGDRTVRRGDLVSVLVAGMPSILAGEVANVKSAGGGAFQEIHALMLADPLGVRTVLIMPKSIIPMSGSLSSPSR